MKSMNFIPGMGLGKNQQGLSEFVEPKVPILKYGLGYQKNKKAKGKAKKQTPWEMFMEEGANYPYTSNPNSLMVVDKLVPSFEIFTEYMNQTKECVCKKPVVEELVQSTELKDKISATEIKKVADEEVECDFESFIFKSIIDVFYDDLDVSLSNLFNTDDVSVQRLMQ